MYEGYKMLDESHEDNHPLKINVGIWPDKSPPKHS